MLHGGHADVPAIRKLSDLESLARLTAIYLEQ